MSTYITVVNWSQTMTDDENQEMMEYINTQSIDNGVPTEYRGVYARSWVDLDAAEAFVTFAKSLQKVQLIPTTVRLYTVD